ncbi:spore coat U domain-containing protein [Comamonas sp. J-3]|uniref:Csu type fimbrial protein n=1 Tax=Comamonas trifloxystrobinivorans TaxID=3350256 RepID=UPI00372A1024
MHSLNALIRRHPLRSLLAACLLCLGCLGSNSAQAQTISCSGFSFSNINFGTFVPLDGTTATTTGQLTFQCRNTSATSGNVTLCFHIGTGSGSGSNWNARTINGDVEGSLKFQIYTSGSSAWGSRWGPDAPASAVLNVPRFSTTSGSVSYTASVLPGQESLVPQSFSGQFDTNHTEITATIGSQSCSGVTSVSGVSISTSTFPFSVSAVARPRCDTLVTNNLVFPDVTGFDTAAQTNSALSLRCTNKTPYRISLQPSNGNTAGQGILKGSLSGNTDTVTYQLYRDASYSSPWGATASTNTFTGTGNTNSQSIPIYGKTSSANVLPDDYSDRVTVTVSY